MNYTPRPDKEGGLSQPNGANCERTLLDPVDKNCVKQFYSKYHSLNEVHILINYQLDNLEIDNDLSHVSIRSSVSDTESVSKVRNVYGFRIRYGIPYQIRKGCNKALLPCCTLTIFSHTR